MIFPTSFILSVLLASSSVFAAPTPFREEQELEARFKITGEEVKHWASEAGKGLAQVAAFAAPIAIQAAYHHYSNPKRDFPEFTMEERDMPELHFEERDFPDFYMEERDFADPSDVQFERRMNAKQFFTHVAHGAEEFAKEVAPIAISAAAKYAKYTE